MILPNTLPASSWFGAMGIPSQAEARSFQREKKQRKENKKECYYREGRDVTVNEYERPESVVVAGCGGAKCRE